MDLIYVRTDRNGSRSGYLSNFESAFDISNDLEYPTNNFEITMELPKTFDDLLWAENQISSMVYVEGTEYGGLIEGSTINIAENTITYTGRTWRGNLEQWIIEPPAGQDYLVVSGNLADSLRRLPMGNYINVENTPYNGGSYQFNRYITTFEGAINLVMAAQSNLRLAISFESNGYSGTANLSIIEARDLTSLIEVSQDYNDKIQLTITKDGNTPRELICLGPGELKDRQVLKLYADSDWNVTTTPIAGVYPVEIYDFSGSENLERDGRNHFAELIESHEQLEVSINDLDIQLSDIISAKDVLTGETVTAEIMSIVWRCQHYGEYQIDDYEYRTKIKTRRRASKNVTTIIDGGGSGTEMDSLSNLEIEELLS